jgi:UDP-N-acetylmuramoyl-tripeptide--D-alanyl-D-alanine ligase
MLELGAFSKHLHEEVGKYVAENKINILVTVGDDAKYIASKAKEIGLKNIYSFDNNEDAINKLKEIINSDDSILVKASNALKFYQIVEALKNN